MEPNTDPEINADPAAHEEPQGNEEPKEPQEPSQVDPTKETKQFSKRERLQHAKGKIEQQLAELDEEEDENRPLTVKEYREMERNKSRNTAVELAESIEDEDERVQVIDLLENRITPSGDPQKDLELARGAVNSIKNAQIAEDAARKQNPGQHGSQPGGPGKVEEAFTPTAEEQVFMQPPYNLSKEQILEARQKASNNQ